MQRIRPKSLQAVTGKPPSEGSEEAQVGKKEWEQRTVPGQEERGQDCAAWQSL